MHLCPARVRQPTLPQPGAAVLSATAGLTSEFGTGSGDPRLHGRTHERHSHEFRIRASRTLAAAQRDHRDRSAPRVRKR